MTTDANRKTKKKATEEMNNSGYILQTETERKRERERLKENSGVNVAQKRSARNDGDDIVAVSRCAHSIRNFVLFSIQFTSQHAI